MDTFVRSAENVLANRERLRGKVDDLIDLIHYIGELLDVEAVAESLSILGQFYCWKIKFLMLNFQ